MSLKFIKIVLAVYLWLSHSTFCMDVTANRSSILKDPSYSAQAQQIASELAFDSIVQIMMALEEPLENNDFFLYSITGLVIHPHGVLSCSHGLRPKLLQNCEQIDAVTMRAKLKYPVYVSSKPILHIEQAKKCSNCWVYFSKEFWDEAQRPESIYKKKTRISDSKNDHAITTDFAFFHLLMEHNFEPVNFKNFQKYHNENEQRIITCSYYNIPEQSNFKKEFSCLELSSQLMSGDIQPSLSPIIPCDVAAYVSHRSTLVQLDKQLPALYLTVAGCSGSPVIMLSENGEICLLGLLTNFTETANLITPIKKFTSTSVKGLMPIFENVYLNFWFFLEKEHGDHPINLLGFYPSN